MIVNRIHWILRALHRSLLPRDLNKSKVKNLIISPGGVGTTFLMDHLRDYIILNDTHDRDGLKHVPRIKKGEIPSDTRIIFLTGDSDDIYNSIKRRGWLYNQASKYGCFFCQFLWGEELKKQFIKKIENQNHEFKKYDRVLTIDYSDIWEKKEIIREFFNIEDQNFIRSFPERKMRTQTKGKE